MELSTIATNNIYCEVTTLSDKDLFVLLNNKQAKFDYPVHYHSDYELNLVMNCNGNRVVGDSIESFGHDDLVLLAPRLPHAWRADYSDDNYVITIQFSEEFVNSFMASKNVFQPMYNMFMHSTGGIRFHGAIVDRVKAKIFQLCDTSNFNSVLLFYDILNTLAEASEGEQSQLTSHSYDSSTFVRQSKSRRIEKICKYIDENFQKEVTLDDIAALANMSPSAVSHFFKKRTNRTFSNYITDVRVGNASKMLVETTRTINDIAFDCGFGNISNFNRIFKKYNNKTPREYRAEVSSIITKY